MLRIYDEFLEDEAVCSLKHPTYRVHVSTLVYCSRNLTDGEVSEKAVKVIQAILEFPIKRAVGELVDVGLWIPLAGGGYQIRNYLEFNPDAETIKKERSKARDRMRKLREKRAGSGEHSDEGDGERAVPERSLQSHSPNPSLAFKEPDLHALTSYDAEGHDEKRWKRLLIATGSLVDVGSRAKLERTVRARKCGPREIECAIEAATGPGVIDPLAVALSELVKRADERSAA